MSPLLPWSDQDLQLFHGTTLPAAQNIVTHGVDVAVGKPNCDFGKGFYCTTSESQARKWSFIKANRTTQVPAVVVLQVSRIDLAALRDLVFVRGDMEAKDYWSFVHHCRKTKWATVTPDSLPYDLIYGTVAHLWFDLKVKPESDQVSFHSTAAQRLLNTEAKRSILAL